MFYPHMRAIRDVNNSSDTAKTVMLTGCPVGHEPDCTERDCTVPVADVKSLDGMTFVLEMPI